jgi:hypothetical protein
VANISISNLHSTGIELFTDPEGFMAELSEGELRLLNGGYSPLVIIDNPPNFIPLTCSIFR